MGLSVRNGWYDDAGRVYIFYTLDEIQEDLNCGHEKAVKLLSELDTDKGCGLIERVKQGQGRPTKIYVKRFTTRRVPAETPAPQETPRLPKIGSQEVGKSEVKSSDNPKSCQPYSFHQKCEHRKIWFSHRCHGLTILLLPPPISAFGCEHIVRNLQFSTFPQGDANRIVAIVLTSQQYASYNARKFL